MSTNGIHIDFAVEPRTRKLLETATELLKQPPADARDDSGQLATSAIFLGFWMLPGKSQRMETEH
jgi:hypothetical protein